MDKEVSGTKVFLRACLGNGLSLTGTMLFVFAGIGLFKQITGDTAGAGEWLFNYKLLGTFAIGGFTAGVLKTIVNAFSK